MRSFLLLLLIPLCASAHEAVVEISFGDQTVVISGTEHRFMVTENGGYVSLYTRTLSTVSSQQSLPKLVPLDNRWTVWIGPGKDDRIEATCAATLYDDGVHHVMLDCSELDWK